MNLVIGRSFLLASPPFPDVNISEFAKGDDMPGGDVAMPLVYKYKSPSLEPGLGL